MLQGFFNSPTQILVVLLIIVLLFGASRLPNTARQMGRSMRIFRSEMKEMKAENPGKPKASTEDDADDAAADDVKASRVEALEGKVVDDRPTGSTATSRSTDADRDR